MQKKVTPYLKKATETLIETGGTLKEQSKETVGLGKVAQTVKANQKSINKGFQESVAQHITTSLERPMQDIKTQSYRVLGGVKHTTP